MEELLTIMAKMTAGKIQNQAGNSPKKKSMRAPTMVMTMRVGLAGGTGWGLGACGIELGGGCAVTTFCMDRYKVTGKVSS